MDEVQENRKDYKYLTVHVVNNCNSSQY